jgi:hypothetical protein
MTVTTPAMTVQVREHDKVMEPYTGTLPPENTFTAI